MALNRIGDENLYIGGLMSLSNKPAIHNANITHVVTVLRLGIDEDRFINFDKHLVIAVDDVEDEDLLQHFPRAIQFIQSGLDAGGGVFVHCAMGKSRSATICLAYLLHSQNYDLDPIQALEFLRRFRPICEPNSGFMEQLDLYHQMGCTDDVVEHPIYQRFLYRRVVEESVACGRAPDLDEVRFEDTITITTPNTNKTNDFNNDHNDDGAEIKCRKCRRILATSPFIIPHTIKPGKHNPPSASPETSSLSSSTCAHIFLHTLSWMRPSLFPSSSPYNADPAAPSNESNQYDPSTEGSLSGRLTCPNSSCGANVGKFSWAGMPCSCGTWVVPAMALAKARVDIIDKNTRSGSAIGGPGGIRLPPGMLRIAKPPVDPAHLPKHSPEDDNSNNARKGLL
ncbi:tyrosine protein phosphatase yvh1 [Myotisia sp. PD_48]|nr:tyrosine protein phosphatase yvh1 [Myotisia sp. PD_48]